jgi:hypothetical protein
MSGDDPSVIDEPGDGHRSDTASVPAARAGESPQGGSVAVEPDAADLQGDGILEGESLPGSIAPRRGGWRQTKVWLLLSATIRSCMRYRVTGLAAEGAFFGVLSLPPLVFGLAGSIGYVLGFLGVGTVDTVREQILSFSRRLLTETSVQDVIDPMLGTVLQGGRADVVSIGFVLALWSGSRALNVFIDTVTIMYGLGGRRGIVKTRALSFSLYTCRSSWPGRKSCETSCRSAWRCSRMPTGRWSSSCRSCCSPASTTWRCRSADAGATSFRVPCSCSWPGCSAARCSAWS